MDASQIADRIYRNLSWAAAVRPEALFLQTMQPADVWTQIKAVWEQPDDVFIQYAYLILLGRPVDPPAFHEGLTMLAADMPRGALLRRLACSAEAQTADLDLSWLRDLEVLERDAVWRRILELWQAPDAEFVEAIYPVLLGRPADATGASALREALAAGMSRTVAIRSLARSAEGRDCGADSPQFLERLNAFEAETVWQHIEALWHAAAKVFAKRLYPILLGRKTDSASAKAIRTVLAAGAPRASVVRRVALSEEAQALGLDVSWLPRLNEMEPDAVWLRVQTLWNAPDEAFVVGLYHALLGRTACFEELASRCTALALGSPRAAVVRDLAESEDARACGLTVSWLPLLDALPTNPALRSHPFSFGSLKTAFRRWIAGWSAPISVPPQGLNRPSAATNKESLAESYTI